MLKYGLIAAALALTGSCGTSKNNDSGSVNKVENEHFSIVLPAKYSLNKNQGKDGVIYYMVSGNGQDEMRYGEIFLGNFPGTAERFHDEKNIYGKHESKLFGKNRTWNIYYEQNMYCTAMIVNNPGKKGGLYVRILGKENSREELIKLVDACSTIRIK
jgi:hypothetical protein